MFTLHSIIGTPHNANNSTLYPTCIAKYEAVVENYCLPVSDWSCL